MWFNYFIKLLYSRVCCGYLLISWRTQIVDFYIKVYQSNNWSLHLGWSDEWPIFWPYLLYQRAIQEYFIANGGGGSQSVSSWRWRCSANGTHSLAPGCPSSSQRWWRTRPSSPVCPQRQPTVWPGTCIHIKTVLLFVVYGSTTVLATLLLPSIKSYKDLLDSVTNKTNNRSVSCAQVCLLQPDEPGD